MTLSPELDPLLEKFRQLEGPLLPLLHAIQDQHGYIPSELEPQIAKALNLSNAEVRGVISFYHDFRTSPPGKHHIKICCAEACQASGARELEAGVADVLGVEFDATHPTDNYRLERVYCLGNCACGPSVRINDDVYGRVDLASLPQLVTQALQS